MKRCDLDTGASRIQNGLKSLGLAWDESAEVWSDDYSAAFQREQLEPIVPVVKDALDAIARMRTLLHEAQRELGD